ncbi:MAG: SIMPL domain-containing protein [Rhizomicrobium sp.]
MSRLGIAAVVALAFSLSVAQAGPVDPHTIVVSGAAEILVSPDLATIDIGVVTSDPVTAKALHANNVEMQRVVAVIKALGISENAMQTSNFSVDVLHPKTKNGEDDESRIIAYEVTNKLSVSVTELSKVADIIDAAVNAGANSANSVTFDVKNRADYDEQALAAAVRNARHNAEIMASAERASVGKMISMTNSPSDRQFVPAPDFIIQTEAPHAPILPGQITILAKVTVTYAVE